VSDTLLLFTDSAVDQAHSNAKDDACLLAVRQR
jgi:hypothetical protein